MSDLTIRRAELGEAATIVRLEETSREAIVLSGSAVNAEKFALAMLQRALELGTPVFVAEREGEPLGFAQLGGPEPSFVDMAKLSLRAVGVVGTLYGARGLLLRRPVDLASPKGGIHLSELQVAIASRGHGVGGALLDAVDEHAAQVHAPHISLNTAVDNPARRLYERHGYEVAAEKRNARYEQRTGHPGRILMVKAI